MDIPHLTNRVGSGELEVAVLKAVVGDTSNKSLIDLCCGEITPLRHLKFKKQVHIDVHDFPLRPRHFPFLQIDVLADHPVYSEKYDMTTCLDGIEHLTREDGFNLIQRMTDLAPLNIVFTPLGDMWLGHEGETDPMVHKSGWVAADFEPRGWETLVFPRWHEGWKFGALFAWRGADKGAKDRLESIR